MTEPPNDDPWSYELPELETYRQLAEADEADAGDLQEALSATLAAYEKACGANILNLAAHVHEAGGAGRRGWGK